MANTIEYVYEVLDRFSGPLKNLAKLSEEQTKKLADFSQKASDLGGTLTKSLTLPLVGIGTAGLYAFGKFEQGMSNISTLIDTNVESIDAMGKEVLAMSSRVPVSIGDLTAALYDVRSAGVSAADQFAVLEGSSRLAVAGLGTTKEAVDLVTSSMNAFGLEGEDAAGIYDIVFKTVKSGKTNISQLAQGFGAVAGTVAASGTKLDEYLASVAALTTTGLPASQAHTQLRAVISGLTRETKLGSQVFRKFGAKDLQGLIEKAGGLVPALGLISDTLGGNQAKILEMVGSTEALNAIIALTGNQAGAFTDTLASMRDGTNAVDEAFEKQKATFNSAMMSFRNTIERVGVAIGARLAPYIIKIEGLIKSAGQWFESLNPTIQDSIIVVGGLAAAAGPLLMVLGAIGSAIAVVGAPIALLVAGGIALAGAFTYFYNSGHPVIGMVQSIWQELKNAFAPLSELMDEAGVSIDVFDAIAWVLGKVGKAIEIMLVPLKVMIQALGTAIELGIALSTLDFDRAGAALSKGGDKIKGTFKEGFKDVGRYVGLLDEEPDYSKFKMPDFAQAGFGGSESPAQTVANQRASQVESNVNVGGNIRVSAAPGTTVEQANIGLNGGQNVAMGY